MVERGFALEPRKINVGTRSAGTLVPVPSISFIEHYMSSHDNSVSEILSDLAAIAGGIAAIVLSAIAIASGLCLANTTLPLFLSVLAALPAVLFGVFLVEPRPFLGHAPVGVYWALLYLALVSGSVWLLYQFSFGIGFWGKVWSVVGGLVLAPVVYAAVFLSFELLLHIVLGTIMMSIPIAALLAFLAFLKGQI